MKRRNIIDKVSGFIIAFNIISFLLTIIIPEIEYDGSALYTILSFNALYIVLGIPFVIFIGIILNIVSMIKKKKSCSTFINNIIMLIIYFLTVPIWMYFLWQALMGV